MTHTFFTDRDLGITFPRLLKKNGINVERHCDHFEDNTEDPVWLNEAGKNGWYCLSRDRKIRYNPREKEAVLRSGVGLFILVGKATHQELADNFINTVHKVERFIERNKRPFIAKIYRGSPRPHSPSIRKPGQVKLWAEKTTK